MKVNQFKFRQGTGVATVLKAENEDEAIIIDMLKELIEDETGALSRKCFTFDDGEMTIDIDRYTVPTKRPTQKKKKATIISEVATDKTK